MTVTVTLEEKAILEELPLPVFITTTDGVYIYCNRAFARFFDRFTTEIVGKKMTDLLPSIQFEKISKMNAQLLTDKEAIEYELTLKNGEGMLRDLVIHKTLMCPPGGQRWIMGTMTDVTDFKRLQNYQHTMLNFTEKLLRISQYIAQSENIQQLLDYMMNELKDSFGQESCGCILINEGGVLRMAAQFGYTQAAMEAFQIDLVDSYFMRFAERDIDRVVRINQIELIRDEDYSKTAQTNSGQEMLSSLSSPIIVDDQLFALINFDAPYVDAYTLEQADFMDYVRKQLAIAIKSMMLLEKTIQLSRNDQLTGLYNRHYFEDQVHDYVASCVRDGLQLHLLVVDADYLKRINDDLGHMAGDQLLVSIAELLKGVCGERALISRHGGDEFAAVVYGVRAEDLSRDLDAARTALARQYYGNYAASFSYGLASLSADLFNYKLLLKAADEAMYREKRQRMGERRIGL